MSIASVAAYFDHPASLNVTWLILHFLWQGVAIAATVGLANFLVGTRSPRLRYGIALSGLTMMFVAVGVTWFSLPTLEPAAISEVVLPEITSIPEAETLSPFTAELATFDTLPYQQTPETSIERWAPTATAIYAIGVALMLLRLACSALGVGRLRFTASVADSELADRVRNLATQIGMKLQPAVKVCDRIAVPFVVGVVKPAILLPTFLTSGMSNAELDAILLHELSHIRRGDLLVNLLQRVAESLLFFHPGVWIVSRTITVERENCCDDIVLRHCSQQDYASALIRLAEACAGTPQDVEPIAALAATGASPSQLKRRVMRILGVTPSRQFSKPGFAVVIACILAITATGMHLQAQTDSGDDDSVQAVTDAAVGDLPRADNAKEPNNREDPFDQHPLKLTLDETGNIVGFSIRETANTGFAKFATILQHLSSNNRVRITSTNIVRKGDEVTMRVVGENLDFSSVRSAVRKATQPEVMAEVEAENAKQRAKLQALKRDRAAAIAAEKDLATQRIQETIAASAKESLEAAESVTYQDATMDEKIARQVARTLATIMKQDESKDYLGPVRIEATPKGVIIRGKKEDVERVKKVIANIESFVKASDTEDLTPASPPRKGKTQASAPNPDNARNATDTAMLERLIKMEGTLSGYYKSSHPELKRIRSDIELLKKAVETQQQRERLQRIVTELRLEEAKLHKQFGDLHPLRVNLNDQIKKAEQMLAEDLTAPQQQKQKPQEQQRKKEQPQPQEQPQPEETTGDSKRSIDITGPVRVEFVEDTFMIRGRKEDVDRVTQLMEKIQTKTEQSADKNKQTSKSKTESEKPEFIVYHLRNAIAEEVLPVLEEVFMDHVDADLSISADKKNNRILVKANGETHKAVRKMLAKLDNPPKNTSVVKAYSLRYVEVELAQKLLERILGERKSLKVAADVRSNLLIVSGSREDHDVVADLIKTVDSNSPDSTERAVLGIIVGETPKGEPGVTVRSVVPGSIAAKAGIKVGDRILDVSGTKVTEKNVKQVIAKALRRGLIVGPNDTEPMKINLIREGLHLEVTVPRHRIGQLKLMGAPSWPAKERGDYLRFPVEVEAAMMGSQATNKRVIPLDNAPSDLPAQNPLRFPIEVEKGMMIEDKPRR